MEGTVSHSAFSLVTLLFFIYLFFIYFIYLFFLLYNIVLVLPYINMKLEPIIQSEVSQKEKHQYSILTHMYGIYKDGNDNPVSVHFSSVQSLSRVRLCDPMDHSMPGLLVHHQLLEFTQTHVHRVSDAIQPSHHLSSPSPLAPNPSQHQSLFQ